MAKPSTKAKLKTIKTEQYEPNPKPGLISGPLKEYSDPASIVFSFL